MLNGLEQAMATCVPVCIVNQLLLGDDRPVVEAALKLG